MKRVPLAAAIAMILVSPAQAQTANGGPTTAAGPPLVGKSRAVTRTAPSAGKPPASAPTTGTQSYLRPVTAAEKAEQKKLERDMKICIGC